MKKLMIAAAIVCAAALSQAATVEWKITYSKTVSQPGTTTALPGEYTLYVFDKAKVSGQDVIDALVAKQALSTLDYDTTWDLKNGALKDGAITWTGTVGAKDTDYIDGQSYTFFTALYDAATDAVLITGSKSKEALDGTVGLSINPQSASQKKIALTSTYTEGGVGWYSTVPEPTSGLLLLLGVAGLALRRRRA